MSETFMNPLERELTACLEPVRAPESVWYRVSAQLDTPPRPHRSPWIAGLVAAAACVAGAWFLPRPAARPVAGAASDVRAVGAPATVKQQACGMCHIG